MAGPGGGNEMGSGIRMRAVAVASTMGVGAAVKGVPGQWHWHGTVVQVLVQREG